MLHWVETHGIECIIAYYILISVLGTMPPLPDNASYWKQWAYTAAHAFCGNMRNLADTLKIKTGNGNGNGQKPPDVQKTP